MHFPHGGPERARKGPKGPDEASIDKRVVDVECAEDDSSGGGPASQ